MSSPIKPNDTYSQDVRSLTKASENSDSKPVGQQVSELAQEKKINPTQDSIFVSSKKQLNAAIIESSLKYNTTVGDQPLSLVLKTALQGINEALKASGVEKNVEEAYESGVDFSPEATAERIVSFSTQFLGAYREQNPQMSQEESLTAFVDIISGGIDQGFGEAKDILGGLKVLEGDVTDNIDKTYALVQSGLQAFVDALSDTDEQQSEL
ncbi:DUF5610 domain-containing protein [Colwellia sp. 6M3]|jgi:hypothetical protein|uniref:DUF5610 domain-containing protein n=1 Tax=Colwellia sp. 6M3 TaxID=2759849 RepID=UPI0015F4342A|nr:DUF5610 domain-containing protein [Colwellia sp. 6M3]MBA6415146.1 DUF5610 domain-containing protein [Colwellia sp. 6M3]|tara:strand:+ start:152 stop:781 length:630 start_codon:yes stop_codon:yes gene_type:complete